jgi:hypothetical protein
MLEGATGRRYANLRAEGLWSRIGAEHDAFVIVKLSSLPKALEPGVTRDHHRAFASVTAALA